MFSQPPPTQTFPNVSGIQMSDLSLENNLGSLIINCSFHADSLETGPLLQFFVSVDLKINFISFVSA